MSGAGIHPRPGGRGPDVPGTTGGGHLILVLVLGPTGVGKTDRAVETARTFGAPLVVLDRVQCHPELASGSGRRHVGGPERRIFLDERRVVDGVLPAASAYRRLCRLLDARRAGGDRIVVLEGGSTSLLAEMAADDVWRHDAEVLVECLPPPAGRYSGRVAYRVRAMLAGTPSMIDEVRALWPDPRTHAVLSGIVGYREVVDAMHRTGTLDFDRAAMKALIEDVTDAHLTYAQGQLRQLPALLPLLRPALLAPQRGRR